MSAAYRREHDSHLGPERGNASATVWPWSPTHVFLMPRRHPAHVPNLPSSGRSEPERTEAAHALRGCSSSATCQPPPEGCRAERGPVRTAQSPGTWGGPPWWTFSARPGRGSKGPVGRPTVLYLVPSPGRDRTARGRTKAETETFPGRQIRRFAQRHPWWVMRDRQDPPTVELMNDQHSCRRGLSDVLRSCGQRVQIGGRCTEGWDDDQNTDAARGGLPRCQGRRG